MAKSKTRTQYICQNCGAEHSRWQGQCRECQEWNTLVEELVAPAKGPARGWAMGQSGGSATTLTTFTLDQDPSQVKPASWPTGSAELDRVLGGGLVGGGFVLLGGDPGIGKSTLLLQMAGGLAEKSKVDVLYVSGEESVGQTTLRAHRLSVRSERVHVAAESNLDEIMGLAQKMKPEVLIVDSIQTVFLPEITSAPGSVSQVRECAGRLMGLAKGSGITVLLIGHVTKEGNIAGPKVLEHMVDTVLSFEGDPNHQFRLLRSLKNRFGPTHELGVFTMETEGLKEVANPSELFLEERGSQLIGSAIFASMEGTRPLLCEIQGLVTPSPMAIPRRTALGVEVNRLHLLVAVLNKHLKSRLGQSDVFVNVVGGLKINEPAGDLAVAAALVSTERDIELDAKSCFFGEIGLTGEVRAVPFPEIRIREALKLGFKDFYLPASNKKHLKKADFLKETNIHWIESIQNLAARLS